MNLYAFSFVDLTLPDIPGVHKSKNKGTCYVYADDPHDALMKTHRLGINPGGQVQIAGIPLADDEEMRPEILDTLFNREDSLAMGSWTRERWIRKKV